MFLKELRRHNLFKFTLHSSDPQTPKSLKKVCVYVPVHQAYTIVIRERNSVKMLAEERKGNLSIFKEHFGSN